MRRLIRFACVFSVLTLLFSLYIPLFAKDNDARFDSYINMGQNAKNNGYEIPNMFRQDAPYPYMSKFPLVVTGGVEYVPLSMFMLYSFVNVTYSSTGENYYLVNNRNNHYISFDMASGAARTHTGETLELPTRIFNQIKYVPARRVCEILGFKCEVYDNVSKGIYVLRISDGRSAKTLDDLLRPYLPQEPVVEEPPKVDDPPKPPVIVTPDDPIEKLAARRVALCFGGVGYSNTEQICNILDNYGIKASFAFEKADIVRNTALLRKVLSKGHSVFVTAEISDLDFEEKFQTDEEKNTFLAKEYVKRIEEANDALFLTVKRKTRMCLLPYNLSDEIKYSREFLLVLEKAGYAPLVPNTEVVDGPGYSGSAYTPSSRIRDKIVNGFDARREATVTSLLYCSDRTRYTVSDLAAFVNKYRQFEFSPFNEALLHNEKE